MNGPEIRDVGYKGLAPEQSQVGAKDVGAEGLCHQVTKTVRDSSCSGDSATTEPGKIAKDTKMSKTVQDAVTAVQSRMTQASRVIQSRLWGETGSLKSLACSIGYGIQSFGTNAISSLTKAISPVTGALSHIAEKASQHLSRTSHEETLDKKIWKERPEYLKELLQACSKNLSHEERAQYGKKIDTELKGLINEAQSTRTSETRDNAEKFYKNLECDLLHEIVAATLKKFPESGKAELSELKTKIDDALRHSRFDDIGELLRTSKLNSADMQAVHLYVLSELAAVMLEATPRVEEYNSQFARSLHNPARDMTNLVSTITWFHRESFTPDYQAASTLKELISASTDPLYKRGMDREGVYGQWTSDDQYEHTSFGKEDWDNSVKKIKEKADAVQRIFKK